MTGFYPRRIDVCLRFDAGAWQALAALSVALLLCLVAPRPLLANDALVLERQAAEDNFAEQLDGLAKKCAALKLSAEAQTTREWIIDRDPNRQYIFVPRQTDPTEPAADAPRVARQWHARFREHRRVFAEQLFQVAKAYAASGDGTTAYQLLHEVVWQDPQHVQANRVLATAPSFSERISRRAGTRTHRDFGWRPRTYWQIESAHYRITTSHSAEAGVELARKLDLLHSVWRQVFFNYWSASESLSERLRGGNARLGKRQKLDVVLFRNRDEYVEQLQKHEPQIAMSLGYYMKGRRTAFFYAGDESVVPTWFHEATHQLFQEFGDAIEEVGEDSNFWLAEGIAVYMESLVDFGGHCTLGGFDADRLQYARARALGGQFYMPLEELVSLGREGLQKHDEIGRIYTQAAGIVHFLMDGQRGEYRRSLVDLVTLLYLGRVRSDSLPRLLDLPLDQLDEAYVRFLAVRDDDFRFLNPPAYRRNLGLGRTDVSDAAAERLRGSQQLRWLDLSFTKVTDKALAHLSDAAQLRQLNLEGTAIGDKAIESLADLRELEELDLSNTRVTDACLEQLSRFGKLKVLWLTNTSVSDAGIARLARLKLLEVLDVSNTKVTVEGLQSLQELLPQLNRDQ